MKKTIITLSLAILTSVLALAVTSEPDSMYVHFTGVNGNSVVVHAIADIDSIVYYASEVPVIDDVAIGDFAHGGVVFYIFVEGENGYVSNEQHGLVCAVSDQDGGSGVQWSKDGVKDSTSADSLTIGGGQANTAALVAQYGVGVYAAYLCDTLQLGGYTDWFLPSKDELAAMYANKDSINTQASNNGGSNFTGRYWSSSKDTYSYAWMQNFDTGSSDFYAKNFPNRVRAVRAF